MFSPQDLARISDSDRAELARELGIEAKTDAAELIAGLASRAAEGDDIALAQLASSAVASLSVAVLLHLFQMLKEDPKGAELRAMMAALPGLHDTVVQAALLAALRAYASLRAVPVLSVAQRISAPLWEDIRDAALSINAAPTIGLRHTERGGAIFMVPPGNPPG